MAHPVGPAFLLGVIRSLATTQMPGADSSGSTQCDCYHHKGVLSRLIAESCKLCESRVIYASYVLARRIRLDRSVSFDRLGDLPGPRFCGRLAFRRSCSHCFRFRLWSPAFHKRTPQILLFRRHAPIICGDKTYLQPKQKYRHAERYHLRATCLIEWAFRSSIISLQTLSPVFFFHLCSVRRRKIHKIVSSIILQNSRYDNARKNDKSM